MPYSYRPSPAAPLPFHHCIFFRSPLLPPDDDLQLPLSLPTTLHTRADPGLAQKLLLSAQPAALFLLDQAGVVQQVGGAWTSVTETEPSEIIGLSMSTILRLPVATYPEGMLGGDGQSDEATLLTRTGRPRVSVSWRHHGEFIAGHLERLSGAQRQRGSGERQQFIRSLDQAVYCLGTALDAGQGRHVERMVSYATRLAEALALGPEELQAVRWGAALHDVGKSRVPAEILWKPGPLSAEEFDIVVQHPVWGTEIIQALEFLPEGVIAAVRHHHERFDGQGYPAGLRGEAVPMTARIVAIADVFDALSSARPYKEAWSLQRAAEYLLSGAETQFDPWLVRVFVTDVLGQPLSGKGPALSQEDCGGE